MPSGKDLVLSLSFDVPKTTYTNAGNATTEIATVSATTSGKAGYPVKKRGLNFDGGADGFLDVSDLKLSHSFSVHAWVYVRTLGDLTVFSRDRDSFASTNDQHLRLSIGGTDSNRVVARLAKDKDIESFIDYETDGTSVVSATTWTYVVWSFELKSATTTEVVVFLGNAEANTKATETAFYVDDGAYKGFIAAERTAASTYAKHFNGFIYDFHVYQKPHTDSVVAHATTCSGTKCWAVEFDRWLDGTTDTACSTDGSCTNKSCINGEKCATCGGNPFCHLCPDYECTACDVYGTCAASSCGSNATNKDLVCECNANYGRAGITEACGLCAANCDKCDKNDPTPSYADCTLCDPSFYLFSLGDTNGTEHFLCLSYCPKGFATTEAQPACTATPALVYGAAFNTFEGPWESNSLNGTATSLYPAYNRGQYFNGTTAYLTFDDFSLAPSFSFESWIRVEALADGPFTLYSKDRVTDGGAAMFRVTLQTDGFLKLELATSDNWTAFGTATASGTTNKVPESWKLIGVSLELQQNSEDTNARLWVDDIAGDTETLTGKLFIDKATPYKAFLGAERTGASAFTGFFKGFVYNFFIYNTPRTTGSTIFSTNPCDSSCDKCTHVDTQCLSDYLFTKQPDGTDCDGTCNGMGCRRAGECHTCDGSNFCHLCYDRECTNCTDYAKGSCGTDKCASTPQAKAAAASGECECISTAARED
jgi:hypothetical protein